MVTIDKEKIVAYEIDDELVCKACAEPCEAADADPDDILTKADLDPKKTYICERCQKPLA
jgi:hypothetical protein